MIRNILIYILLNIFACPSILLAVAPSISSTSGTLSNGNTITVSGSNFGSEDKTDYIVYINFDNDDAGSYWPADGYTGTPIAFDGYLNDGVSWPGKTNTVDFHVGGEGTDVIVGHHSIEVTTESACYSTGWGFAKWVEYEESSSGEQGAGLGLTISNNTEIYLRFYQRWNSSWPDPFTGLTESKQIYFYIGNYITDHDYVMAHLIDSYPHQTQAWWRIYNNSGSGGTCLEPSGNDCEYYTSLLEWSGSGVWREYKYHLSLASGANDTFEMWIDGTQTISMTGIELDSDSTNEYFTLIRLGANFSGPDVTTFLTYGTEDRVDRDDVVVSTSDPGSVAAVYISDQSTWGSGPTDKWNGDSDFIRQKIGGTSTDRGFESWSDSGFKFEYQDGSLSGPLYLYVYSWGGEYNSSGYALSGDSTPPTISAASANGTTISITTDETTVWTGYDANDCNLDGQYHTDNGLSSPSGSGTSWTLTAQYPITAGETVNLDCTLGTDDIEDAAGNDMVTFADTNVTNNTAQSPQVSGSFGYGVQVH